MREVQMRSLQVEMRPVQSIVVAEAGRQVLPSLLTEASLVRRGSLAFSFIAGGAEPPTPQKLPSPATHHAATRRTPSANAAPALYAF